jgi:hypothetical protein
MSRARTVTLIGGALLVGAAAGRYGCPRSSPSAGSRSYVTQSESTHDASTAPIGSGLSRVSSQDRPPYDAAATTDARQQGPILDLPQRFEALPSSVRSRESEERVRSLLDSTLAHDDYTVECRRDICRLDVALPGGRWLNELPQYLFSALSVDQDNVVHVLLPAPSLVESRRLRYEIGQAIVHSPALDDCEHRFSGTPGDLTVRVQYRPGPAPQFRIVDTSGTLSSQPGGQCLRKIVEAALTLVPREPADAFEQDYPLAIPCDICRDYSMPGDR